MLKYLIDVNLPYYFSLWNSSDFIHQKDINDESTDEDIWNYAKERNLTIISKDSDFSDKIIFRKPPPRIIHIRIGNVNMKEFHSIISKHWNEIKEASKQYKLIQVYANKIDCVL